METQKNNNSNWWKWLLGIAAAGGAWYLFAGFKTPELPISMPDDDPPFDENLEVSLWKNYFLSQGTDGWPNAIMAEALKNSGELETLFREQLQYSADQKYVSDGATTGAYRTAALRAIQTRILAIKRVPAWVEAVKAQATERGISYEAMLQINALYGIIEEKIKAYLVRYKAINGSQQGGGQSGFKGTAII